MRKLPRLIVVALVASVAVNVMLYTSVVLNVIQGHEIRALQFVALDRLSQIYKLEDTNDEILKALNNRETMETFMLQQTEAYYAVLDAFYEVKPPMPQGNIPKDPELQRRALKYYRTHGEPWGGKPEELLTDEADGVTSEIIPAAAIPE